MRIVLADSRPRVRVALRALLEEERGLRIVGDAAHSHELLAQVEAACPDLVLLSWELPGLPGRDLVRQLRESCPSLRVIVVSGRRTARQAALTACADAFVSKIAPAGRVVGSDSGCPKSNRREYGSGLKEEDRNGENRSFDTLGPASRASRAGGLRRR